jgi:uracil-DNA glycosylase
VANPYRGAAGAARLANLRRYLDVAGGCGAATILVGEAPGYRGCAVTGIPFTSRRLLVTDLGRWGLFAGARFEAGEWLGRPHSEATASIVWRHVPRLLPAPPLVWNAFPFHPHPPGDAGHNRPLDARELEEGLGYLQLFLRAFPDARPIAVGRRAAEALARLGRPPDLILRHPARGGAMAFARGLAAAAIRCSRPTTAQAAAP